MEIAGTDEKLAAVVEAARKLVEDEAGYRLSDHDYWAFPAEEFEALRAAVANYDSN